MTDRTYTISDTKPVSPLIYDKAVIFISDIQDEGTTEEGGHQWSYIQDRIVPMNEYLQVMHWQAVTESYAATVAVAHVIYNTLTPALEVVAQSYAGLINNEYLELESVPTEPSCVYDRVRELIEK